MSRQRKTRKFEFNDFNYSEFPLETNLKASFIVFSPSLALKFQLALLDACLCVDFQTVGFLLLVLCFVGGHSTRDYAMSSECLMQWPEIFQPSFCYLCILFSSISNNGMQSSRQFENTLSWIYPCLFSVSGELELGNLYPNFCRTLEFSSSIISLIVIIVRAIVDNVIFDENNLYVMSYMI